MHVYTIDRIQYNVSNHLLLPMSSEHFGRFQHHHLVFPSMAIGTMQNILYLRRNHLPRRVKELIVPVFNFPPLTTVYTCFCLSLLFACKQEGVIYFAHLSQQKKKLFCLVLKQTCFDFFFTGR